jgi:hypothetical protein
VVGASAAASTVVVVFDDADNVIVHVAVDAAIATVVSVAVVAVATPP